MTIQCYACQHTNPSQSIRCQACDELLDETLELKAMDKTLVKEGNPVNMSNAEQQRKKTDDTTAIPRDALQEMLDESLDETELNLLSDDYIHSTMQMPLIEDEDGLLHIGRVRFNGDLILQEKSTGKRFHIANDQLNEVVVGRYNRSTGFYPTIDLSPVEGKKKGVSRRHATINQRGDLIFITDHGSLNGTYLNGQRLIPDQARIVRDGDTIRIAHITLYIKFEHK